MTKGELIKYIQLVIQDDSFDPKTDILPILNRALFDITSQFCLPDLIEHYTCDFEIGDTYQSLPDNYSHDLFQAQDHVSGYPIFIRTSTKILDSLYPTMVTGRIQDIAIEGTKLYIKPIIAQAQSIDISYYRKPEELITDADEPEGLPEHLHKALLCNYALAELYSLKEDGIDSPKINTEFYTNQYVLKGLGPLKEYYKNAPTQRSQLKRTARFF